MSIQFELENNNVAVFHITEKLKKLDFEDAQAKCEEIIKKGVKIKILTVTENFEGWEKAKGWGDWSFADRNDTNIEKIAVVGDEKWKNLVFAFTGKGLRPVVIEYFDTGQEANARYWLNAS